MKSNHINMYQIMCWRIFKLKNLGSTYMWAVINKNFDNKNTYKNSAETILCL